MPDAPSSAAPTNQRSPIPIERLFRAVYIGGAIGGVLFLVLYGLLVSDSAPDQWGDLYFVMLGCLLVGGGASEAADISSSMAMDRLSRGVRESVKGTQWERLYRGSPLDRRTSRG